ncbi:MAG: adenylate kinase [Clostridia bacterium]|nr:adenylate kinase [Clostridia bacterium]
MIVLITGATHTGKTALAQKLLDKYNFPYLSIDHLKMGLIRSKQTELTAEDDEKLVDYLWPIVREMIKTAVENNQNLIVEGCYIPFDWRDGLDGKYLKEIKYICLIMTKSYIENNFSKIAEFANVIEKRLYDACLSKDELIKENEYNLKMCQKYKNEYILIDKDYEKETTPWL